MKKLVGFLIFIAIIAGGVFFVTGTGKTVDVSWTEADYTAAAGKTPIVFDSIESVNLEALATGKYQATGTQPAEVTYTSAEFSSLVAKANDAKGPIRGTRLKFTGTDAGEVSFKLSEGISQFLKSYGLMSYEPAFSAVMKVASVMPLSGGLTDQLVGLVTDYVGNKPVYADGYLRRTGTNSIEIKITSLSVGQIPMNAQVVGRTEYEVTRILNAVIAPEHGFSIEELRIEAGQLYYKGTLPAEIKGTQL